MGTKGELVQACSLAKQHQIEILIDAVLNVFPCHVFLLHKGSRWPSCSMTLEPMELNFFPAVPVDPNNRLKGIGPERDIEVS